MAGKRFDSAFGHAIDPRQPHRWASIRRQRMAQPKAAFIPK
jgi:hypothetical protein